MNIFKLLLPVRGNCGAAIFDGAHPCCGVGCAWARAAGGDGLGNRATAETVATVATAQPRQPWQPREPRQRRNRGNRGNVGVACWCGKACCHGVGGGEERPAAMAPGRGVARLPFMALKCRGCPLWHARSLSRPFSIFATWGFSGDPMALRAKRVEIPAIKGSLNIKLP